MIRSNYILNIVIALHCEAKPLIDQFHLKKITHLSLPFSLFVNKEKTIHLIISGVGKIKVAAATTFLFQWTGSQASCCFLNVGIAGATEFNIGEGVLAHKIIEQSTGRSWYPFNALLKNKNQTVLTTHDLPQETYPSQGMIDMEGSAFFQTANMFVSKEQILIFKIISDNNFATQKQLIEKMVSQLITAKLNEITEIINYLSTMSEQEYLIENNSIELEKFLNQWHFTHSQTVQLKECLRRWRIQSVNPWEYCCNESSAKDVINKIMMKLDDYANCLH